MSTRYVAKLSPGSYTGSHAGIGVDPSDKILKVNSDGTIRGVSACGYAKILTAATTLTAADSGGTFFLNATSEFATTLPAPALGLSYKFFVLAAPSGADYTIVSASSANVIVGQVYASAGSDEDSETSGGDTVSFVGGTAVKGDSADFWCDGTNWYVRAFCNATGGVTITTAS